MQRALVASSVVLALVLGWLLWQRGAPPSEAAKPAVAAAPAPLPVEPAPVPQAEPVKPPEPVEPAKAPEAVAADLPAAKPAAPKAPPRTPSAAAMNAIFGDRPSDADPAARVAPTRVPAAGSRVATGQARPAPILAPVPVPADPPAGLRTDLTGGVAGVLRDAKGAPIAGVNVVAVSTDGLDAFETITGDDGFYLMSAMKPGRYVLFPGLGTPLGARIGAPNFEVVHGQVRRHDLVEPVAGSTLRVRSLRADGLPAPAQVVLVRGRVATPASLPALLAGEAIFLSEADRGASVLRRVPAGVYTMVVLQGADAPPRVVREPVTVKGQGEMQVDVRVPGDLAAAWRPAAG